MEAGPSELVNSSERERVLRITLRFFHIYLSLRKGNLPTNLIIKKGYNRTHTPNRPNFEGNPRFRDESLGFRSPLPLHNRYAPLTPDTFTPRWRPRSPSRNQRGYDNYWHYGRTPYQYSYYPPRIFQPSPPPPPQIFFRGGSQTKRKGEKMRGSKGGRRSRAKKEKNLENKRVVNLSTIELSKPESSLLNKGLKFAPSRKLNKFEMFIDINKYVRK